MEINLLENAFDYILDAVLQLQGKRPSKRRIKYAIIHLWSGIELVLKKRLMDEHWSLIFRDVNKADKNALNSGNFISVYFDDAVVRLKKICGIDIAKYKDDLDKIREDRNRLEHFQMTLIKPVAISNLVKAWSFVLDFVTSHIDITVEPKAEEIFAKIRKKIIIHEEFIAERLKLIGPKIERLRSEQYPHTIIDCPLCFQDSWVLKGGHCECLFCKTDLDWETAMRRWLILHEGYYRYYDKDRLVDPLVTECPECEYESLYMFENGDAQPPDPAAFCFNCGSSFLFCEWCSLADVCPDDEDGVCRECSIYLEHKQTVNGMNAGSTNM